MASMNFQVTIPTILIERICQLEEEIKDLKQYITDLEIENVELFQENENLKN
jgi:regulator of replication initiation timing